MATREAHLAYVKGFADSIVVGGPVLDDAGNPNGSVLIMEFDTKAEAEAFCADDPYAKAGLFVDTKIVPWRQTLARG
jgi:hypothetical protein